MMNTTLTENNYIYIPNFISEASAKIMASNFKKHCEDNNVTGDSQAENSSSEYNFIDFLEMLCEKSPIVSQIIGETVLPTYSYARVYRNGSILKKHKDRDACEISLTIHLDGDKEWPIYIETPKGEEVELILKPGDAMLYLGCVSDHWRNQFLGREYIQVFLHYVRSRGNKSYAYFDKIKENNNTKTQQENINKLSYKKNLEDYIVVLENIFPEDLCEKIEKEYFNSQDWIVSKIGSEEVDLSIRNVNCVPLSLQEIIFKNFEIRKHIDQEIFKISGEAIQKYRDFFPFCTIQQDSGYELLRYNVGQFYTQHVDSYKLNPRAISCSFAINDDYEGGEFAFFDGELKYNLKKGSAILFPSNFMYPHEIMPVTKGTRYSIITWFI